MKRYIALLSTFLLSTSAVTAEEMTDHRQLVEMPPQMQQMFLKNMRGHMEALDQIIAALAENDLNAAADIAETTVGSAQGKKRQCDENKPSQHKQTEHKKKAFGQFIPPAMKAMGRQLHISANEFAVVARQGDMGEAYKSLSQISSMCVACHQSFQVKSK
ncbi:MAG: cytochrome c [Methylophaga sp.]|nr:cytochrome c [Methylophaga sp.]